MSVAECASKQIKWALRANKQADEQVAQYYLRPHSWLFRINVEGGESAWEMITNNDNGMIHKLMHERERRKGFKAKCSKRAVKHGENNGWCAEHVWSVADDATNLELDTR